MASSSARWVAFLAALLSLWACAPSFGVPASSQQPLSVLRESAGLSINQKTPNVEGLSLSRKEKVLMSKLAELGKKGDWQGARGLYEGYKGSAAPVLTAAMQAAYRCKKYQEAAAIYYRLRALRVEVTEVSLPVGMQIFGKLQDPVMVDAIWAEVTERGWVNRFNCGARMDALAYMGNVEGAASVLDIMRTQRIDLDEHKFNAPILACANAKRPSHDVAMYLFEMLLDNGFAPTIVTFTNLARAHAKASLEQIQQIRAVMKEHNVPGNKVFAESYLSALVQGRRLNSARTKQAMTAKLADLPEREGRLKEAESALLEMQASNVQLTALCQAFLEYMQQAGS
ncbi:unnamed protein product [Symbiodinium natans]|uniref:Pentacotripeptide-repeat region of PRORP domain-containing protein n=1 Tax=Symbiodinium natans TaxID=878477 RepID=A0A812RV84_9DINO|nr:unnamed protein product [Symbiodinium natans]